MQDLKAFSDIIMAEKGMFSPRFSDSRHLKERVKFFQVSRCSTVRKLEA
jgi:hypothetical protein